MKNILKKILLPFAFLAVACDFDKDISDPNQVQLDAADINLILNAVELDFADFYDAANGRVAPLVRHSAMTGGFRYANAYVPQNQNDVWDRAYNDVLVNAKTIIDLGTERNFPTHVAIAKILTAYTYITLVDLFGDVPQADALKAQDNEFNPGVTPGATVYAYAIQLLGEARTGLTQTGPAVARDIYYPGTTQKARWTALANTLELKAWVNISTTASRKAEADARIATLLAGELIDTYAESFTYKYSATTVPDSRHPLYNQYYGVDAGLAGGYIGTSFMFELFRGKNGVEDPRWRYYFSRQAGSYEQIMTIDPKALGCTPGADPAHYRAGGYPFCMFDPGFYGRDHGDASGTPPDGPVLTAAGVYPAGGRVDNADVANANFKSATQRGQGANGAGILPIWMGFYTDFLKAEINARNGVSSFGDLDVAVRNSIAAVKAFADSKGQEVTIGSWDFDGQTELYMDEVSDQYAAETDKLKAVGRETWVATWGNGVEAYNSYRRTGGPRDLQPTIQTAAGVWMRSLIYSANYVNLNLSATQKDADVVNKVFWDGNPEELK